MKTAYPHQTGIDLNAAAQRLNGKTSMLNRLLNKFIDRYMDAEQQLSALMQQGDTEETKRLAHQIKGAAANLGVDAIAECAKQIESHFLEDGDAELNSQELNQLTNELRVAQIYIKQHCQDY